MGITFGWIAVGEGATLPLVKEGSSPYRIVIGEGASEAEQTAAKELAHFVKEATGVALEVVSDEESPVEAEIVLGATNRLDPAKLPPDLLPATGDGYTCRVEGRRIYLVGRYPRGTLYGVYDWLEENVGVRFLAPDATHIPSRPVLEVATRSFAYDPPMEYRNICTFQDDQWGVRNRLNARWGATLMEKMLGGVRWVGKSIHSAHWYVPQEQYFESNPEYFAMVKGKRTSRGPSGSQPSQLCFTNEEVYQIILNRMKGELDDYRASTSYNPSSKLLLSLSNNDGGGNGGWCSCPPCKAINDEEETHGGTLYRTLNRLSDALVKEYPEAHLETLAYSFARKPPAKTVLRDRIVIRFAPLEADLGRLITDPESERNRKLMEDLKGWQGKCSQIYLWNYYYNSWSWLDLFPDIELLVENLRLYRQYRVNGLFAESSYTPASELRELRHYLLAQAMWKQEMDEKAVIREFCELYYGAGATEFLNYLQFTRNWFLEQAPAPLLCQGRLTYSDAFLEEADAILERAEQAATTAETKFRVAVARLPVWYQILQKQFSDAGKLAQLPGEWSFRPDPGNRGLEEEWQRSGDVAQWAKIPTGSWVEHGYPRGVAWYANTLEISDEIPPGRPLALYFGAVDGTCDLYLNGEKIGEQKVSPNVMWDSGFFIRLPEGMAPGRYSLVLRVEKHRSAAGITKPVSLVDLTRSVSPRVRTIGERFMEVAKEGGLRGTNSIWRKSNQIENDLFPKIRTLLSQSSQEVIDPRHFRKPATLVANIHDTWAIVEDEGSLSGAFARQKSDRKRNRAQGVTWRFDQELTERGAAPGSRYRLRVRVRLRASSPEGVAFSLGYYEGGGERSGFQEWPVEVSDLEPNQWQWIEAPEPIELQETRRVFVTASENPTVESIDLDAFELVPEEP